VLEAALAAQGLLSQSPETRATVRAVREAVQKKPNARAAAFHALFMWARRRFYFEKRMASLSQEPPPKRAPVKPLVGRSLPVIG
jgi:hypothetical protein